MYLPLLKWVRCHGVVSRLCSCEIWWIHNCGFACAAPQNTSVFAGLCTYDRRSDDTACRQAVLALQPGNHNLSTKIALLSLFDASAAAAASAPCCRVRQQRVALC
jgi:hypothetical protein